MTVMGWINLDSITGDQCIFGTNGLLPGGWSFGTSGDKFGFTQYGVGGNVSTSDAAGPSLSISTWYHIAVTYNDNALEFFLNGNSVGTVANAGLFTEEGGINNYGVVSASAVMGADQFYGRVDELKIFDNVLSGQEIISHAVVPEPSTTILGALGILCLLRRRR